MPNMNCLLNAVLSVLSFEGNDFEYVIRHVQSIIGKDPRVAHARILSKYLPVIILKNNETWAQDLAIELKSYDLTKPVIVVLDVPSSVAGGKGLCHANVYCQSNKVRKHSFSVFKYQVISGKYPICQVVGL